MIPDIRKGLKQYAKTFLEARDQGLNEADTSLRLTKFFEEVLHYDALKDISKEANYKNKFIDICLKVEGVTKLLVEVKAASVTLRDRHIEQAQTYAAQNNFRWVLLTNGVEWNLYHLTFEEGIEYEVAYSVTLADPEGFDEAASKLAVLHKKAIRSGELESFWEQAAALGPESIGKALFAESVIGLLRREIRRETGLLIDPEDLVRALHEMLSLETRERIGPPKLRRRRKASKKKPMPSGTAVVATAAPAARPKPT